MLRYLDNKLVFLAGSTGLAGSSILRHIIDNYPKTEVRACYFRRKPFIKDKRIKYVFGDLRIEKDCLRVTAGCDVAVMAAAETAGSAVNMLEPWRQVNDNVIMNSQMLRAFSINKIKRAVYAGSATLYQESEFPMKEGDLDLNIDPHPAYFGSGWVTRFVEKLCRFWYEKSGMEMVIGRASNVFGPYSKFDPLTSNFIPALIRKAAEKMDPFEVWGGPAVTRDVIYADDFAGAVTAMLESASVKFDTFNIGSGAKTSVGDVVGWVLKHTGHTPKKILYLEDRPTTVKSISIDCSKADRLLGWRAVCGAEEGVRKTAQWWLENRRRWRR